MDSYRDPDINVLQEHGRALLRSLHAAKEYQITELWRLWNITDYSPWNDRIDFQGPWKADE